MVYLLHFWSLFRFGNPLVLSVKRDTSYKDLQENVFNKLKVNGIIRAGVQVRIYGGKI